ncbi:MAG: aspartate carbamoyltransferase catalytic subunit [Candidatus Omnitrophota bacterium]
MALASKHLFGLKEVSAVDIKQILDTANNFKEVLGRPIKTVPIMRGKTVANLFFENSTRTRISFELAEKRLSCDSVSFTSSASSVKKGETLRDTVRNIEAMKVDMAVVRHSSTGVPAYIAGCTDSIVINAGDGANEHPTQALLDMLTIQENFGKIKDLRVAIVGDIMYSRVARSNIWGLKTMGASVMLCGPKTLMPPDVRDFNIDVTHCVEEAIEEADVIMVLRIQLERQSKGLFPSLNEYRERFGINSRRLRICKRKYIIMHPGPINRGLELDSDVADSDNSVILNQVSNGVAIRMACLYLLGGGQQDE